jgi:hypothetical protein
MRHSSRGDVVAKQHLVFFVDRSSVHAKVCRCPRAVVSANSVHRNSRNAIEILENGIDDISVSRWIKLEQRVVSAALVVGMLVICLCRSVQERFARFCHSFALVAHHALVHLHVDSRRASISYRERSVSVPFAEHVISMNVGMLFDVSKTGGKKEGLSVSLADKQEHYEVSPQQSHGNASHMSSLYY